MLQLGYSQDTVGLQLGYYVYSQVTAMLQLGYSQATVRLQLGYSQATVQLCYSYFVPSTSTPNLVSFKLVVHVTASCGKHGLHPQRHPQIFMVNRFQSLRLRPQMIMLASLINTNSDNHGSKAHVMSIQFQAFGEKIWAMENCGVEIVKFSQQFSYSAMLKVRYSNIINVII